MKVYETYGEYLKAVHDIQRQGIVVDWNLVEQRRDEARKRLGKIKYKELRYDPARRTELDERLYTDLGLKVLQRTSTGKPKTDVAVLQTLRRMYPEHATEIGQVLSYRNLQKADGTWYTGYLRYKDETGLIHPNFKVHGTKTGRLSCESPNLQQIPRQYDRVKVFFRDNPTEDEVLVELDFSQIELRVAAYYAKLRGDSTMYDIYLRGDDVHTKSTELVGAFDQIPDRKEARQVGKTGNFLWIYGGGAKTMSEQLYRQFGFRSTESQCREWTDRFHEAYPGFRACIRHAEGLHKRDGYITFWNGRRRRIRERADDGSVFHRKAFNSRVQGGCGQLLMYAAIRLHKAYESGEIRSRVCNTVHDSFWVYVPKDDVEGEIERMSKLMRLTPEKVFKLPFDVDAKVMVQ